MNKEFCKLQEEKLSLEGELFINDSEYYNQKKMVSANDLVVTCIAHKPFGPGNHYIDIEGVPHPESLDEAQIDWLEIKEAVLNIADKLSEWGIDKNAILSGPSGVGWHLEWYSDIDNHNDRKAIEHYLIKEVGLRYTKDIDIGVGIDKQVIDDDKRVVKQFGAKHTKTNQVLYKTSVSISEIESVYDYPVCYSLEDVKYPDNITIVTYPKEVMSKARKQVKKEKPKSYPKIQLIDNKFLRNEPVLAYALRYTCPTGSRNNVLMKNLIAGMVGAGMSDDEIKSLVAKISSIQLMSAKESLGWLVKSRRGEIVYNRGELINWIKKNKLPIRYYPKPMIGDPNKYTKLEPCTHKKTKLVYVKRKERVLLLEFECLKCKTHLNQGALLIDKDMPLINWRQIEGALIELKTNGV